MIGARGHGPDLSPAQAPVACGPQAVPQRATRTALQEAASLLGAIEGLSRVPGLDAVAARILAPQAHRLRLALVNAGYPIRPAA